MSNSRVVILSRLVGIVAAGAWLNAGCGTDESRRPIDPGSTGSAGAANAGSPTASGGGTAVASGGGGAVVEPPKPGVVSVESAGRLPLRRLTHREYSNTMLELLGDASNPGANFEPDGPGASGFEAPSSVATETARGYMEAAETLAASAFQNKKLVAPCATPADTAAETTCVASFVKDFGAKSYRRDLVQTEVDDLVKLFAAVKALGSTFQEALNATVEAMLQSPNLLYRWEVGDAPLTRDPDNAALVALTPEQLASRLSYFLWESPPDAALMAAAKASQLASAEGVKAQAERLLSDDTRARRALVSFHRQWLHMDNLDDLAPGTDLGVQLGRELEHFVSSVITTGDGTLKTLLTAPYTFANAATAPEYGLSVSGSAFTRVELDPAQRAGVLMQVPFLRTNGNAPPVRRGLAIYKQLLCGTVPPPPGNIPMVAADTPDLTLTTRERFDEHADLACATGCHALFDPWGFALESFDSLGHYRTQEKGKPIDASGLPQGESGVVGGTTPQGAVMPFRNGVELVHALAESSEVSWCASRHWSRYVLGRMEGDADAGALSNAYLAAAFEADRITPRAFSVKDFLIALVTTKAFRFRALSPGEAP